MDEFSQEMIWVQVTMIYFGGGSVQKACNSFD